MTDPNILSIFSVIFILLGLYNVNTGIKRLRQAQQHGQTIRWNRNVNLLTGIEFMLLALVFLLSLSIRNNVLPTAIKNIEVPLYLLLLLASAVLAGFVIWQAFRNVQHIRQSASAQRTSTFNATNKTTADVSSTTEQQAITMQRRRERRQKAAAARRRRTGKA